jgi:DNA-binding PadR family transcriptional regulator
MDKVILGLLMIRPMTVYEINGAFKAGISLFFSASYGSIQSALKKLFESGKISFKESEESGRHKKTYSVTAKGKDEFHDWIKSPLPECKLEVNILSKIYFLGLVRSKNTRNAILQDIRNRIDNSLNSLNSLKTAESKKVRNNEASDVSFYQMRILDYGINSLFAGQKWVDDMLDD